MTETAPQFTKGDNPSNYLYTLIDWLAQPQRRRLGQETWDSADDAISLLTRENFHLKSEVERLKNEAYATIAPKGLYHITLEIQ